MNRSYDGAPVNGTVQYITERPALDEDEDDEDEIEAASETVYATSPEPQGEETAENVPVPGEPDRPPEGIAYFYSEYAIASQHG